MKLFIRILFSSLILFAWTCSAEQARKKPARCRHLLSEKRSRKDLWPTEKSVIETLQALADAGVILTVAESQKLPCDSPHIAAIDRIREGAYKSAGAFTKKLYERAQELFQRTGGYYGALAAAGIDISMVSEGKTKKRKELWPTPGSIIRTLQTLARAGVLLSGSEAQKLPENSPHIPAINRVRKRACRSPRAFARRLYVRALALFKEEGGYYGALAAAGVDGASARKRETKKREEYWPTREAVTQTLRTLLEAGVLLSALEARHLPPNSPHIAAIDRIRQGAYKSAGSFVERLHARAGELFKNEGGYYGALEAASVDVSKIRKRETKSVKERWSTRESMIETLKALADAGVILTATQARELPENSPHIAAIDRFRKGACKSAKTFAREIYDRAYELFKDEDSYYGALAAAGVDVTPLRKRGWKTERQIWPTKESAIGTLQALAKAGVLLTAREARNLPADSPFIAAIDRVRNGTFKSSALFTLKLHDRIRDLFENEGGYCAALAMAGIDAKYNMGKKAKACWPAQESVIRTLQALARAGVVLPTSEAHDLPKNHRRIAAIDRIRGASYKSAGTFMRALHDRAYDLFKGQGGYYGALDAAGVDISKVRKVEAKKRGEHWPTRESVLATLQALAREGVLLDTSEAQSLPENSPHIPAIDRVRNGTYKSARSFMERLRARTMELFKNEGGYYGALAATGIDAGAARRSARKCRTERWPTQESAIATLQALAEEGVVLTASEATRDLPGNSIATINRIRAGACKSPRGFTATLYQRIRELFKGEGGYYGALAMAGVDINTVRKRETKKREELWPTPDSIIRTLQTLARAGVLLSGSEAQKLPESSPHIAAIDRVRNGTYKSASSFMERLHVRTGELFKNEGGYYGALAAAGIDASWIHAMNRTDYWPTREVVVRTLQTLFEAGVLLTPSEAHNLPKDSPHIPAIDGIREGAYKSACSFIRGLHARAGELFKNEGGYYGALAAAGVDAGGMRVMSRADHWPTREAVIRTLRTLLEAGVLLNSSEARNLSENSPHIPAIDQIRNGTYKSASSFTRALHARAGELFKNEDGYYGALAAAGVDVENFRLRSPNGTRQLPPDFITGSSSWSANHSPTPRELLEREDASVALSHALKGLSDREKKLMRGILKALAENEELPLSPQELAEHLRERGEPYTEEEIRKAFLVVRNSEALRDYDP